MNRALIVSLALFGAAPAALAQLSNIDEYNKYCWSENIGFLNWRDADSAAAGVRFYPTHARGAIWGENIGWIRLGSGPADTYQYTNIDGLDYGVNVDPFTGELSGLAWGENIGWVNFGGGAMATPAEPARIDSSVAPGRLRGYVWGENVGWINLDDDSVYVGVQCLADFNGDGFVTGEDFDELVALFEAGDPLADINGDTFVTGEDFDAFVQRFIDGC